MTAEEALVEMEKARAALGHGVDDVLWRPGETAVDALIRRAEDAEARVEAFVLACREVVEADDIIKRNVSPMGGIPDYADMNWDRALDQLREVLSNRSPKKG